MSEKRPPHASAANDLTAVEPTAGAPTGRARYQEGRELGRGGMGRVFEAVDLQFDRAVAVKELLPPGQGTVAAATRSRFESEALITGNLDHPGIPTVYERGLDAAGLPFYAMQRVQGRTLESLIAESGSLEQRLGLLTVVIKIAETLGYAHEHGVLHR